MEILTIELVDDLDSTVKVTILNKGSKEMNVYVQTVDNLYRQDLGCIMYSDEGDGTLNEEDFDNYDSDIKKIIKEVEKFIADSYEIHYIKPGYIFKIFNDRVILSEENPKFVNADSSSYQLKYFDIEEFETLEEAKKFLKAMPEAN